jgi:predicted nucleotidyltransferase
MAPYPDTLAPVPAGLARKLRQHYGGSYRGLVLYGSHSRGEADKGSDVALLLLLSGEVSTGREVRWISSVTAPLSLETGYVLSVIPVGIENYYSSDDPLLANARREGVYAAG